MATGQWTLKLDSDTPWAIKRDTIDRFGHIFVFDSPMRAGLADATMIATSRWGGIVRRVTDAGEVSGGGMIAHLGDEDGKGPMLETKITGAPSTFATLLAAILTQCPAVTAGTLAGAVAGTSASVFGGVGVNDKPVTARVALDLLCREMGVEYRVNKDASIDYAVAGVDLVFKTTAGAVKAVAMRRSSGRDANLTGISVTQLGVSIDAEEYITRSLVQDSTGGWTAVTGTATPYKDLKGNLMRLVRVTVSTTTAPANAAALAANLVAAGQVVRNAVTLTTDEFDVSRDVAVGDYIWVFDVEGNMVDLTNPGAGLRYRGSIIYPLKLRVLAVTWPIERGMSVWYRSGAGVWTDLTSYVLFEPPGASFEVGAIFRPYLTKAYTGQVP